MLATLGAGGPAGQLYTSGIGPVRADGSVPDDVSEQAEVVWATVMALVVEAGMTAANVVQVSTFVVDPGDDWSGAVGDGLRARLGAAMAARDAALDGHRCASVLVPVPALATASWKLEVAVVAISGG